MSTASTYSLPEEINMDKEQILKVLKNERECITRQGNICNRDCANCDLVLPDNVILEVYDFLINDYTNR